MAGFDNQCFLTEAERETVKRALDAGLARAGTAKEFLVRGLNLFGEPVPRSRFWCWWLEWALALVEEGIIEAPTVEDPDKSPVWEGPLLSRVSYYYPKVIVLWGCQEYIRRLEEKH